MKPAALLQQAAALEERGDLAGAIAGYRKVLAREPSNIDALFLLGRAHCQAGQLEDGAKLLRRVVTLRPDHPPAQTVLGMTLARLGQAQAALACFDRALGADPHFQMALTNKAEALLSLRISRSVRLSRSAFRSTSLSSGSEWPATRKPACRPAVTHRRTFLPVR